MPRTRYVPSRRRKKYAARTIQKNWRKKRRTTNRNMRKRDSGKQLVLGGFPASQIVRLKYETDFSLTPTGSVVSFKVMRLNSIYDPDVAGVGTRPRFCQVWDRVYKRYTVIGAKVSVTWVPQSGQADGNAGQLFIYIPVDANDTALPPYSAANVGTIFEYRNMKPIKMYGKRAVFSNGKTVTITKKLNMKKYFKVSDIFRNTPIGTVYNYSGKTGGTLTGSNPLYECNALIGAAPCNLNTPTPFVGRISIEYIVKYDDVIEPVVAP